MFFSLWIRIASPVPAQIYAGQRCDLSELETENATIPRAEAASRGYCLERQSRDHLIASSPDSQKARPCESAPATTRDRENTPKIESGEIILRKLHFEDGEEKTEPQAGNQNDEGSIHFLASDERIIWRE